MTDKVVNLKNMPTKKMGRGEAAGGVGRSAQTAGARIGTGAPIG